MEVFIKNSLSIFNNHLLTFILFCYLLIATYTDLKYLKIYDKFNLSLVLVRVMFMFLPVYGLELSFQNIIASVSVFLILLTFAVVLMHKMGGDIKFLTAFMLFFDLKFMVVFMAIASLINLIYLMILKRYLLKARKKALEEINKECKNSKGTMSLKDKINYNIIKLMVVKKPTIEELISIDEKNFKKYRVPFAPFFLISYVLLVVFYYFNI